MPVVKEREYRALAAPLSVADAAKRIQTDKYVEGYATTFNQPYVLWEFEDGTKYYEQIDRHALDGADMSDVIMQYDHEGRVFARQSNKTLLLIPDDHGLLIAADLDKTELARGLYEDIAAELNGILGQITVMQVSYSEQGDRPVNVSSSVMSDFFYGLQSHLERVLDDLNQLNESALKKP